MREGSFKTYSAGKIDESNEWRRMEKMSGAIMIPWILKKRKWEKSWFEGRGRKFRITSDKIMAPVGV